MAVELWQRGLVAWPSSVGIAFAALLHASGVAAARGLLWGRVLVRARRTVLPNFDPLRVFAAAVDRHVAELAALEVANSGHPISSAEWEAGHVRDVLQGG